MANLELNSGMGARRSMLVPVLLALLILAAAGAWFAKVYVHPSITASVSDAKVYPVRTEYKPLASGTGTMMVGSKHTEDSLYVLVQITLRNRLEAPLFLSSSHGSFTLEDGSVMEASMIETSDLPRLFKMFPALRTMADATTAKPLERDGEIAKSAESKGYLLMYYNVAQDVWEKRKSAEVSIDLYHQDRLTLLLPQ